MTERELEIRERIAEDRTRYCDTLLTLQESHIVMDALRKLEGYEKENNELRDRLRITKMALEYSCLENVQGNEKFLDELKEKVNKYIEKAEDIFNSEKNSVTFRFAEVRLKGEKK